MPIDSPSISNCLPTSGPLITIRRGTRFPSTHGHATFGSLALLAIPYLPFASKVKKHDVFIAASCWENPESIRSDSGRFDGNCRALLETRTENIP
jgi:hypothetical protein